MTEPTPGSVELTSGDRVVWHDERISRALHNPGDPAPLAEQVARRISGARRLDGAWVLTTVPPLRIVHDLGPNADLTMFLSAVRDERVELLVDLYE